MKIIDYELVELAVDANAAKNQFPFVAQPTLTSNDANGDIGIKGIEIFTIDSMPLAPSGTAVSSFAQIQNAVLTLMQKGGGKALNKLPLVKLLHVRNAAAGYFAQSFTDDFDDLEIDWVNSYVQLPAALGAFAAFTYVFGFTYGKYAKGSLQNIKLARTR